jgi:hypothetical protein
MSSERVRRRRAPWTSIAAIAGLASVAGVATRGAGPMFYPDDPIAVDDDRAFDASGATPIEGSNGYDFAENTFGRPGERAAMPAANINTIDEVPDSTWFTNRIGRLPMTEDEIVRGPNQADAIDVDGWPIVSGKSSGITPGYRVADPTGHLYQIKFDPPGNPEMGSGAEVIGAALYHAIGYNVVQGYIVEIDPRRIVIAPTATTVDMTGRKKRMDRADVAQVLQRAAWQPNGKYRAIASRYAEGKPLGYFRYYGTRPDDPNDIYPHEHRRELRGNRVFAAWLNHDDSRGLNTLDMLEGAEGHKHIRHYMFDFGSIMGSGSTRPQAPRAGNEYILEWKPSLVTLATLGFWVRPWIRIHYPDVARSVGRFEADVFNPVAWKPEYPNAAFDNMQPDDAFWAARLVARFSDEAIRAVVAKARYSEPGAADYTAATLIKRRDKVLRAWLTSVDPIVDPKLSADGTLTFDNAAVAAGVAPPPRSYELTWSKFDNATGTNVGEGVQMSVTAPRSEAPAGILQGSEFVAVAIRSLDSGQPEGAAPVTVHFRRSPEGWRLVGLSRRHAAQKPQPSDGDR